ncbi:MAG: hypothetical protein VX367_08415, partial [SAR324 cluster bacterium]|nr:hypothetical protein [SAR324 cluster bacterium]
ELAREREVASRTEINRARKAILLEWLEAPNAEPPEESPANVEEDQQVQGELFPTPPEVETVQEAKEEKTESDEAPPQEPPIQASLEDEAQKEGAWDTMTLILVGLAVVALLIYLFR